METLFPAESTNVSGTSAADPRAFSLGASPAGASPTGDLSVVLATAVVALVPLATGLVAWAARDGDADFNRRVTLAPFDLALFALLVLEARASLIRASGRTRGGERFALPRHAHLTTVMVGALALLFTAAFALHPSVRGVELAVRILGGAALARVVVRDRRARLAVTGALVVVGSLQAALAVAQAVKGAPLGLRWLEFDGPLYVFAGSHAGRGGFDHPYHLAVYLLVAVGAAWTLVPSARKRARILWIVGIVACGAGLGVTYSRALLLGVALAGLVLGWHVLPRRRAAGDPGGRARFAVVAVPFGALALGLALTAIPLSSGWLARYQTTTTAGSASSGRVDFARQALDMSAHDPLLGVGPGRYTIELASQGEAKPLPVHNLVLLVTAEAGVPAGLAMTVLGALLVARWLRPSRSGLRSHASALTAAAFCLVAPFFLLDAYPMTFPTGLALTAVWIGLLEAAQDARSPDPT
jgi:hypothetical protein